MAKIILDCDPGHDDAIAILLAAGNSRINLLGITTVSGNHNVENTTRNALAVCTAYGIRVPVAKGSPGPLIIDQVLAVEIHGNTGLDGPVLPPASFELDKRPCRRLHHRHGHGARAEDHHARAGRSIHQHCARHPQGAAHRRAGGAGRRDGGSYTRGNITPAAEFNVYADPEAAEMVFRADWDVTMVGLDLTHQAQATPELQDRVRAVGGPISKFILDIWEFIATTHGGLLQIEYPAVHDACCVAAMIDPTVFTTEKADIRVEVAGRWTKGMTVCNFEKMGGMRHFGGAASEQPKWPHRGDEARPSEILQPDRPRAAAARQPEG